MSTRLLHLAAALAAARAAITTVSKDVDFVGTITSVCDTGTDGGEPKMYLTFDAAKFEGLFPGPADHFDGSIDIPEACAPYQHAFYAYSNIGHPPWDGKQNGFGIPHFDVHFYTMTAEEREEKMGTCVVYPRTGKCDMYAEENEEFYDYPDPAYTTGFVATELFGGNAVPKHGTHLLVASDAEEFGPLDCRSSGTQGNWQDCHFQQLSVFGMTPAGIPRVDLAGKPPFPMVDHDCKCSKWQDGVSPILMTFGGEVTASEIMPSLMHSKRLGVDLSNPYTEDFPVAEKHRISLRPAVSTWSYKPGDGTVQFGLVLGDFVMGEDLVVTQEVPHVGMIKSVCVPATEGGPEPKLYLEFDAEKFENLFRDAGPRTHFDGSIAIPSACLPYQHIFFAYSSIGHPSWDGKQGGFGVPHWDIHAYTISDEERVERMGTCITYPGTGKCDITKPDNAEFYKLPPPEYTTGFGNVGAMFGGNGVPKHGLHLIKESDMATYGPLDCKSTGSQGNWRDCHFQMLSILGLNPDATPRVGVEAPFPVVEHGCQCAKWSDGVSPILMTFGGSVIASEIMPSLLHAARLGKDLPNPYTEDFPVAEKHEISVRPAVSTWSYKTDEGTVQFGLVLGDWVIGDDATTVGDDDSWYKKGDPSKGCTFVAQDIEKRCTLKGEGAVWAFEACQETCGAAGATCEDKGSWHKKGEEPKDCAWAARFINRCAVDGADGTKAYETCRFACKTCDPSQSFICDEPCGDDPSWFKNNAPDKTCKAFVAADPAKRCTLKGAGGVWAFSACKETCGACAAAALDDPMWFKAGDKKKDCKWAKRFVNRCAVDGEDGRKGYEACPFSCGTTFLGGGC